MGRRRVPEKDEEFNAYINNTSRLLESGSPIGSVRLGLSNNEKIQWLAFRDEWNLLYPQYTNLTKRTRLITEEKNSLKDKFTKFAGRPLGKIALSNNVTEADREVFKVPARKTTRTPRGAMHNENLFCGMESTGGGRIKVRVRLEHAEGRPRLHRLADAVEMKYLFVPMEKNFMNPKVLPDDCTHSLISKTALFHMDAGYDNLGKRMLAFFRWVNFTNPAHNSPWCEVVNVVVG